MRVSRIAAKGKLCDFSARFPYRSRDNSFVVVPADLPNTATRSMRLIRVTPLAAALASAFALADAPAVPDVPMAGTDRAAAWQTPETQVQSPVVPATGTGTAPETVLTADQMTGVIGDALRAEGEVVVTRGDQTVESDWLDYFQAQNRVLAGPRATLLRANGDKLVGRDLDYLIDAERGVIYDADMTRKTSPLRAEGSKVEMLGDQLYRVEQGRFTTCEPGRDDWYIRARDIGLNYLTSVGEARSGVFEFQGVPLMWAPYFDFPLDGRRKSGLLTPTFGMESGNGFDFTLPYYWNIAPNRDATITPRMITSRGLMLGGEYRYLDPDYHGTLVLQGIDDRKYDGSRNYVSFKHSQRLSPTVGLGIDYNRASDDNYFRDFGSGRFSVADNTNLLQDAYLTWNPGWGSWLLRTQKYQTLQDPAAPITTPYQRLPQIVFNSSRQWGGVDARFTSEYVNFAHPTLQEGERLVLNPSVSLPLTRSWGYATPELGLNYTRYALSDRHGYADQVSETLTRTLPMVSVDSGLFFNRPFSLGDNDYVQTLEPRLYYVYIPYRDQSRLPVFDTVLNQFDYAQIFTPNRYSGYDRINDANQVTTALTSRFIDPDNGLERLRVGVAARYSFIDQRVTLPGGTPPQKGLSDILVSAGGDLNRRTRLDGNFQWNNTLSEPEYYNAGIRYSPDDARILSLRYRYDREVQVSNTLFTNQKQIDLGILWPIAPRWYGYARENYSLSDKQSLERLAGVEYRAGCWAMRFLAQRYVNGLDSQKTSFFFQLELAGLGKLGNNPLEALKLALPGYVEPSRNSVLP
ncbi:LPS-assembly protein LptD [Laribacter hongkongensis]|uniref:LPS-assembly protein LptD n=1 Tax=Laribacter hongkongensis TaxID=168471 RepID=UPI001EFD12C7|nr:LPS-assembly protein LptD [Laribacter hongkongensis]MCG9097641.1 LPS-assembly protein LptD [Laribacter hongkongensis]